VLRHVDEQSATERCSALEGQSQRRFEGGVYARNGICAPYFLLDRHLQTAVECSSLESAHRRKGGSTVGFDALSKFKEVKDAVSEVGFGKADEIVTDVNLLLKLLQDAGYEIGQLNIELSVPPIVTIDLKTNTVVDEAKLTAISQANKDKQVVSTILASLAQANRLRHSVKVETLELLGAKVVLTALPKISLQWKQKAETALAAAGSAAR